MITFSFFFRESNKKSALLLCIREKKERVRISTGIVEEPKYFDIEKQAFIKSCPDSNLLNEIVTKWSMIAGQEIRLAELENRNVKDVANRISMQIKGASKVVKKEDTVNELYRQWVMGEIKSKKPDRVNLYHYRVFCEYVPKITFDKIDYKFLTNFVNWMEVTKGYKVNTIGSHIKDLKAVMSIGQKLGLHSNEAYKQFAKPAEDVDNVYLTKEELQKITALSLKGMLEKARDLFLIGCYTAMRFSDYSNIRLEDVEDKEFIKKRQQKTKGEIVIPIHPKVREIITKYGGAPKLCQAQFNKNIKEVCRLAGIDDDVYNNGIYKKKYELVTSHTARRTGATLMYLQGVPTIAIMMITGHKSESSFKKYIKVTLEENALNLAKIPFFRGD